VAASSVSLTPRLVPMMEPEHKTGFPWRSKAELLPKHDRIHSVVKCALPARQAAVAP
jgi:hypothetical protein